MDSGMNCSGSNDQDEKPNKTTDVQKNDVSSAYLSDEAFSEALMKIGLTPSVWLKIFQDELSINNIHQLQHLTELDVKKLTQHTNKDWERKTLRTLIQDENESFKNLQNVLSEVKKSYERLSINPEEAKKSLEKLRSLLQVPNKEWESKIKKINLDNLTSSLEFQTSKINAGISRKFLEDKEVIKEASGGLALMGVYITNEMKDLCEPRQTVIQLPNNMNLRSPLIQQEDDIIDISSIEINSYFHRAMDVFGLKLHTFLNASKWQFGALASRDSEKEESCYTRTDKTCFSRVKYSSVPIKACELTHAMVRLIPEAVQILTEIETLNNIFCREEFITSKCRHFFQRFGSHINIGVLHFGGVFKWIATYSGETKSSENVMKQLVNNSLNCYVNAFMPSKNLGIEVSAKYLSTSGNISQTYSETDLSNTTVKILKSGGPPEIDDFYVWKYILSSCNSTWSLIDRGKLCGIWEIISNHVEDFNDTERLSQILKSAWESRQISADADFTKDKQLVRMFENARAKIKNWIKDPNSTTCIELLEQLVRCKALKIEVDGSIANWMNLLHGEVSIKQLIDIIAKNEAYATRQISYAKYLVREIMHPLCDERFTAWYTITKWSTIKQASVLTFVKEDVKTTDDLLNRVRTNILPLFISSCITNPIEKKSVEEKVTYLFAKACFYCFSSLDNRDDAHGKMLLTSMLIKLKYDDKNYYFPTYLSEEEIQCFVKESENDLKQYHVYSQKPVGHLQAFLIHQLCKRLKETYLTENTQSVFDKCLLSIRHILDERISKAVEEHTSSFQYKWRDLQEDLRQLAEGREPSNTLFSIPGITLNSPLKIANIPATDESSQAFKGFLDSVGLLEYFPNRISLSDILEKQIDPEKPEYTDLPWIFLKDLVMCNYNGRDEHLQVILNYSNVISNEVEDEDDWNIETSSPKSSSCGSQQSVNPLDLIMAVYMCCSPVMQQTLITNMFSCKLGIPFVLPSFRVDKPLVLLLWSMRHILIERKVNDSIVRSSALNCPCQIVSFIRLCKLEISKSNIINQLLSKSHNTYFNVDCPLGTTNRLISDGMIEAAWNIPSQNNDKVTLFLNLRGNAMSYPRQTEVLLNMSSVLVVAFSIDDMQNPHKYKTLINFHKSGRGVVLGVEALKQEYHVSPKQTCQKYLKNIGNFVKRTKIVKLGQAGKRIGLSEIADNIKKAISSVTPTDLKLVALQDEFGSGISTCLSTDEKISSLHNGVLREINELKGLLPVSCHNLKAKIVPLQSSPWITWSETRKELIKSSEFISKDSQEHSKQKMLKQRLYQLEKLENIHPFMRKFINLLIATSSQNNSCEVFMNHVKFLLDGTSNLEEIEQSYQSAVSSLRSAKKEQMSTISELQSTVEECERQLLTSSFGFEHLIREIGQIYEAVTEPELQRKIDDATKIIVARFPEVCARIILMGQPFEIMDGDAGNVPEGWVKSVLLCLKSILGEKKVWTLSVLGIQSSGKSTLLNTMFGLQFPVSAGRCTRGLYMQLVPVDDKTKGFDYILIIDTEGLRAEELINNKQNNDNKLATFVIGLADTTIINIFGENGIAINDILQIVVIAFLRLRQAQRKLQLKQGCVFVHQNVSALNAKQKLAYTREVFVTQLNNITKEAAENEQATDISSFNQLIEFDSDKDVWYFPSLWLGALPMAPRNPEYSISVENLKISLVNDKSSVIENFLTLHDVSTRLGKLWEAILSDDFVFNFRNSMELKAYNTLEIQYQNIAYKLEQFVFNFTNCEARSELVGCDEKEALEEKTESLIVKCEHKIIYQNKILQKELSLFIDKHPQKENMKEWEQNRHIRLNELAMSLTNKVKSEIDTLKEETLIVIQIHDKKYEEDLNRLATELAHNFGKQPDDKELENVFDEKWIQWMMDFSSRNPKRVPISIENEISSHAYKIFFDITPILDEYFKAPSIHCYKVLKCLTGTIQHADIEGRHIQVKDSFFEKMKILKDRDRHCKNKIIEFTNKLFRNIEDMLKQIQDGDVAFSLKMGIEIFNDIKKEIQEHNQDKANVYYSLNPSYKAMLVTHVVRYITVVFEEIDNKYHLKHSPQAQLEKYKPATLIKFKGLVKKKTEDVIAADIFMESLRQIVIDHVSECLPREIYRLIQLDFPLGKTNIIKQILSTLANQGSYKKFFEYIKTPNQFARQWLIRYVNDNILSPTKTGSKSEYIRLANIHIDKIFIQFSKSVSATLQTTSNDNTISEWMTIFMENINSSRVLPFSRNISIGLSVNCDVGHFTDLVMAKLSEIKDAICHVFECTTELSDGSQEHPIHSLMLTLWGCKATCPFCHEPCKHSSKAHIRDGIPHACIQHRITAAAGHYDEPEWYAFWSSGNKLMIETCNDLVHSDDFFHFNGDFVPWKSYRKYLPDWDIEPGSNNSDFWKWFVWNYKDHIEREYGIDLTDVPSTWVRITKQKAIDSLF